MARRFRLTITFLLCCPRYGAAQTPMGLLEADSRVAPSYAPLHLHETVQVEGVVPAPAVHLRDYSHIVIQEANGEGLTLQGSRKELERLKAGDFLRAVGTIEARSGLPVLAVESIEKEGRRPVPEPQRFALKDLQKLENLGRYITVTGTIVRSFENSAGDELRLTDGGQLVVAVFLPRMTRNRDRHMQELVPGNLVRITGFSSQYCLIAPFNRNVQVLIDEPKAILLLDPPSRIPRRWIVYGTAAFLVALGLFWLRERWVSTQRRVLRGMTRLSEEVIASSSPAEIAKRLEETVPELLQARSADIYLHGGASGRLDRVVTETRPEPHSLDVDTPVGTLISAIALCFRNSAQLHVPNTRRSPLFYKSSELDSAKGATFIPLLAQRENMGVLVLLYRGTAHRIHKDLLAALQHLGNQVAASLRLQEQQSMREQLLRSERMAAAGQLISGVADDLRSPLTAILNTVERTLHGSASPLDGSPFREIAREAKHGVDLVHHLLEFSGKETSDPVPVNIHEVVSTIAELRSQVWNLKGIKGEHQLPVFPVQVLANQSQLEQVFLNLIVQAEQDLLSEAEKCIRITSRVLGAHVQIALEVSSGSSPLQSSAENGTADTFSWKVSRAIVESHRGELTLTSSTGGYRIVVDLPIHQPVAFPVESFGHSSLHDRALTAILVEPDLVSHRSLLLMMSARGHRVIPVDSAEQAADMVQRMRFDILFASVRLPGLSWVQLFRRVRRRVGAFVLLTEPSDADGKRLLQSPEGHVLCKPVDARDLDALLAAAQGSNLRNAVL